MIVTYLNNIADISLFLFFTLSFVFGSIFGSFFALVIYRFPKMIYENYYKEIKESGAKFFYKKKRLKNFNLLIPSSHCPKCKKSINFYHNIPIISFILLKAKCSFCKAKIAKADFLIEIFFALFFPVSFFILGINNASILFIVFSCIIFVISFIDFKNYFIPDELSYILIWLGLLVNLNFIFTSIEQAIFATIIAYFSLYTIYYCFKIFRKKEALGFGDFKFFAAFGSWFGISSLSYILFIASTAAIAAIFLRRIFLKKSIHQKLAFAPFLSFGAWIYFVYLLKFNSL